MWVVVREDAKVHPCIAHPRHPWLEKPPELQPTHQIALTSFPLLGSEEQEQEQEPELDQKQ